MVKIARPKIYIETTVFNYYFLKDPKREDDQKDTILLFREIEKGIFESYFSEIVILEIEGCAEPKRTEMLKLIEDYKIQPVKITEGYEQLAQSYIDEGIIPEKKRNDALHIALASINTLDTVVSWNCEHIVKYRTRKFIKLINEALGYKVVDVNTPKEVLENV